MKWWKRIKKIKKEIEKKSNNNISNIFPSTGFGKGYVSRVLNFISIFWRYRETIYDRRELRICYFVWYPNFLPTRREVSYIILDKWEYFFKFTPSTSLRKVQITFYVPKIKTTKLHGSFRMLKRTRIKVFKHIYIF